MDEMLKGTPMAIAVVAIALIFLLASKKSISALLNRIKKVGPVEMEGALQADQQVLASKPKEVLGSGQLLAETTVVNMTGTVAHAGDPARAEVLRTVGISPLILEREDAIRRDVANLPEEERQNLLIRNLAIAQLNLAAEQIYRLIFGSQVKLLEHLNFYGATSKEHLIELFYKPAALAYPKVYERISPAEFFRYPETNDLIVAVTDSKYILNVRGKAFLEWIVSQGILVFKPF